MFCLFILGVFFNNKLMLSMRKSNTLSHLLHLFTCFNSKIILVIPVYTRRKNKKKNLNLEIPFQLLQEIELQSNLPDLKRESNIIVV